MTTPRDIQRLRAIRLITILVVIGVAGIAAIVSYAHMSALGVRLGESWRGRLIPLSVDGFIVAGSMVLIDRRLRGLTSSPLAWGAVGTGIATSFIANAADAASPGAMLWSAWPAVAFAGTFELLLTLFRGHAAVPAAPGKVASPTPPVTEPSAFVTTPNTPVAVTTPPAPTPTQPPPAPASTHPAVASVPAPASRPHPEPLRSTSSVVVPITPARNTTHRVMPSTAPVNELTPAVLARVRAELSGSPTPLGRRELAKRCNLTEHIARQALERVRSETQPRDTTGTQQPRKARGNPR